MLIFSGDCSFTEGNQFDDWDEIRTRKATHLSNCCHIRTGRIAKKVLTQVIVLMTVKSAFFTKVTNYEDI